MTLKLCSRIGVFEWSKRLRFDGRIERGRGGELFLAMPQWRVVVFTAGPSSLSSSWIPTLESEPSSDEEEV